MIPKLNKMTKLFTRVDDTFTSADGRTVIQLFMNDSENGTGSFIERIVEGEEDTVLEKLSNAVPLWFIKEKQEEEPPVDPEDEDGEPAE